MPVMCSITPVLTGAWNTPSNPPTMVNAPSTSSAVGTNICTCPSPFTRKIGCSSRAPIKSPLARRTLKSPTTLTAPVPLEAKMISSLALILLNTE